MTRINIEIKKEAHQKAKINSIMKGITLIKYIHESIEEKIKKEKIKWEE